MNCVNGKDSDAHENLASANADFVKHVIRNNEYKGHTAGLCPGLLQCNLVILPEVYAEDFRAFCLANPIPCPLVGQSKPGSIYIDGLGSEIDIRTDLPLYRIYRNGITSGDCQDIKHLWQDDFVSFAIGCSFTFENALQKAGIEMRHVTENVTVPMYKTSIPTRKSGVFHGPTVVSMRPIRYKDISKIIDICATYPHAHGEPIHIGDPKLIGIDDIHSPDWGCPVNIHENEVPVFWGCGVTSQVAISNACPDICITHSPGAMLITDISELPKFPNGGLPTLPPKDLNQRQGERR